MKVKAPIYMDKAYSIDDQFLYNKDIKNIFKICLKFT